MIYCVRTFCSKVRLINFVFYKKVVKWCKLKSLTSGENWLCSYTHTHTDISVLYKRIALPLSHGFDLWLFQVPFRLLCMVPFFPGIYSTVFMHCVHTFGAYLLLSVYFSCGIHLMLSWQIKSLWLFPSWNSKDQQR